jgi:hypothetical protein
VIAAGVKVISEDFCPKLLSSNARWNFPFFQVFCLVVRLELSNSETFEILLIAGLIHRYSMHIDQEYPRNVFLNGAFEKIIHWCGLS